MVKVAAIDVGSHAVRFVTVEVSAVGSVLSSSHQRYGLKLGADTYARRTIPAARIDSLLRIFRDIAARLQKAGVDHYRAVATAALRDARNGASVARRLERQSGVRLDIIDGHDEIRLVREALLSAVGWVPPNALLVDVGGGSLELGRASGRGFGSLPVGSLRLLETHAALGRPASPTDLGACYAAIRRDLARLTRGRREARVAVGTGGNLDALARLVPVRNAALPAIDVQQLYELTETIAAMTVRQRVRRFGIRRDRAEGMVPAALILAALADRFGIQSLVAPGTGLREALLHRLAIPEEQKGRRPALWPQPTRRSAPKRSGGLARVAGQLFHVFAGVHGLWRPALGPLLAGVHLFDLDGKGSPEHLARMWQGARFRGLGASERAVATYAAAAARGRSRQQRSLRADVLPADRDAAERLGGLLHLAALVTRRGATALLEASLLENPRTVDFGLNRPLLGPELRAVERTLGCRLRVR